jgi:hypothetical protein
MSSLDYETPRLIFTDNVFNFSKDITKHAERLPPIFFLMRGVKFTLNLAKCRFMSEKEDYIGHTVTCKCVGPEQEKVKAIRKFPGPRVVQDVRPFLGLSGY